MISLEQFIFDYLIGMHFNTVASVILVDSKNAVSFKDTSMSCATLDRETN